MFIDNGLIINIISSITLSNLNISFSHFTSPTLILRAFKDTLYSTLETIVLSIKVGDKTLHTLCYVIKGDMKIEYSPWFLFDLGDLMHTFNLT